jgi:hypothetical protein
MFKFLPRLKIRQRLFGWIPKRQKEISRDAELERLERFVVLRDAMAKPSLNARALLQSAARDIKEGVKTQSFTSTNALIAHMGALANKHALELDSALENHLLKSCSDTEELMKTNNIKDNTDFNEIHKDKGSDYAITSSISNENMVEDAQAAYRLLVFKLYCENLVNNSSNLNIPSSGQLARVKLARLIDASLQGTPTERLNQHLMIFSGAQATDGLNQEELQANFYTLLEPEIFATENLLYRLDYMTRKQKKALKKYASTYLLDVFELNVKSRCVFNWVHPNYDGLKAVEEETKLDASTLCRGVREFFPEAAVATATFLGDYTGTRRAHHEQAKDDKQTLRYGAIFFILTFVMDMVVGFK